MGIRETINKNQKVTTVLSTLVIIGLFGYIAYYVMGMRATAPSVGEGFFTVDDGSTWFTHVANEKAPFEHQGQQAVRAYVYECCGESYVAWVERYSPEAMEAFAEFEAAAADRQPGQGPPPGLGRVQTLSASGLQIKRPGDTEWISSIGGRAAQLKHVRCPHGGAGTPQPVIP